MEESDLRKLTKSIRTSAKILEAHASSDSSLVSTYNAICDVLDTLNEKLAREREGRLEITWKRLPVSSSAIF